MQIAWDEELGFGVPEGRYLFKVTDANTGESQKEIHRSSSIYCWLPSTRVKSEGVVYSYARRTTLLPGGLRALLGKAMPKSQRNDLDSFIGKTAYAEAQKTGDFVNIVNWEPPHLR